MRWNIAGCQMPVVEDTVTNLHSILTYAKKAKDAGADVICFPECSLIHSEEYARNITVECNQISALALELQINIIFGSYALDVYNRICNQAIVVTRKGEIVLRYNKRHIYRDESVNVIPGIGDATCTLDGIQCGVCICWDYAFPEDLRLLSAKGVDVIFCPSYLLSHPYTHDVLDKMPQVRAFDTMSYFVMIDAIAKDTYQHSKICHPLRCLAAIEKEPGIIYAEVDISDLQIVRDQFPNRN